MLAPTPYLSATELNITEEEDWALAEVQRRLESGELKHQSRHSGESAWSATPCAFNMRYTLCGTVACLGGWMALLMGFTEHDEYDSGQVTNYVSGHRRLHKLFYPSCVFEPKWRAITPDQTVMAIKHFRLTGDADEAWQLAMK